MLSLGSVREIPYRLFQGGYAQKLQWSRMSAQNLHVGFGHSVVARQEGAQLVIGSSLLRRSRDPDLERPVRHLTGELTARAPGNDFDAQVQSTRQTE